MRRQSWTVSPIANVPFAWLRANSEKYNVDPNRIGAYGYSAGAHLVSILGLASAKG